MVLFELQIKTNQFFIIQKFKLNNLSLKVKILPQERYNLFSNQFHKSNTKTKYISNPNQNSLSNKQRKVEMQQSISLSTKSNTTTLGGPSDLQRKQLAPVNWISVMNFLENEYTMSTIRQKEWLLEKKILNEQILKLKNQLTAVQTLNFNLRNRIKLLQITLKKQKLLKKQHSENKTQNIAEKTKTIEAIKQFFQKNGFNLSENSANQQKQSHKQFLTKIFDEAGINFGRIQQKFRKSSIASIGSQKVDKSNQEQKFQTLINNLNKIKISSKLRINAHLDAVRGLHITQNNSNQTILTSVSQDCLVKVWMIDGKNKQKTQNLEPISCLRQHTGQLFAIDGGQTDQGSNDLVTFTAGAQEHIKVWYMPSVQKPQSFNCVGQFSNQKHQPVQQSNQSENQIVWNLKYRKKKLLTSASDGIIRLFSTSIQSVGNKFVSEINPLNQFIDKNYIQIVSQWVGDKAFLAGCSNSPKINLWDIERSKIVQKYIYEIDRLKDEKNQTKKQNYSVLFQASSLKYISDFRTIYAGCEDNSIRIFSYDENKIIKKLSANDSISCLDFYKNNLIVAGCQNGELKVWDRRTYKLLIDEKSHTMKYEEGILCVKATQNGIFSGGADGIVNFFSI